ncbi:MAG: ACP S-malonyltransferase [Acetobacteraceae bacterium]
MHAFIFPGQGSQSVGMGRELVAAFPAAREVFEEVDEALKRNLTRLMFEGPAEELVLTANAQPALMAVSLAALRVLEREAHITLKDKVALVAGHSLGEYTALAAAGSFSVSEAARLLRLRGEAMQEAVPLGAGTMAAVFGLPLGEIEAICAEVANGRGEIVAAANDNGGGQVVISGATAAVSRAAELARARGAKRALALPVSAPFHCSLMAPAAAAMKEALADVLLARPTVPVVANVTAAAVADPAEIKELLVRQVTGLVRWRESVLAMIEVGVTSFVELGAGRVLSGLVRRIAPDAASRSCGTPQEIEAVVKAL